MATAKLRIELDEETYQETLKKLEYLKKTASEVSIVTNRLEKANIFMLGFVVGCLLSILIVAL